MHVPRKNIASLSGIAAVVLLTTSCASTGGATATSGGQEIKLGAPVTVSGDSGFVGIASSGGFKVAETIINADAATYLGSSSRTISVTTQDAGATTAQAITLSRGIAADPSYLAIVGPSTSPQALALAPFAQSAKIPLIIPSSPAPGITDAGSYVFQIAALNDLLASNAIKNTVPKLGLKKVGVIYSPDNNANKNAGVAALAELDKLGVASVPFEIPYADQDYTAAVSKMRDAAVDSIFIATQSGGAASAMVNAQRTGLTPQWLGGPQLTNSVVASNGGAAAIGAIAATDYNPNLDTDLNKKFRAEYLKVTGKEADVFAAQAFTSVLAVAAAVKSIPGNETVTRDNLTKALSAVKKVSVVVGDGTLSMSDKRTSELVPALLQLKSGGAFTPFG
jgi:branched-chain amino acid transport system substrate-binding protein